jgi:diguanylate cyclase (GGDEF)-like protein
MLDLDHFKQINDSYGHATGDAVLKHFSLLLQKDLRETDLAGRIGGEEFAVIMPGATSDTAMARAERLRKLIENELVMSDGRTIKYTVSIGVTQFNTLDSSADVALVRADEALYRAKEKRNCVAC